MRLSQILDSECRLLVKKNPSIPFHPSSSIEPIALAHGLGQTAERPSLTLRTHALLVLGRQHSTIFLTTPPVRGGGGDLCLAPPRSSLLSFVGGNGGARRCVRARGMGKEDGGGQQPSAAGAEGGRSGGGAGGGTRCSGWRRAVRPQCVAALLLGAAVALSALFWLPPFAGRGSRAGPPDPGSALAGQLAFRLPRSRAYLASSFLSSRFHF
jgi:hypothetical protein